MNFIEGLEYHWEDRLGLFDFVYEPIPVPNGQGEVFFIVPGNSLGYIDTLTITVKDRCNGLTSTKEIEFEVVE